VDWIFHIDRTLGQLLMGSGTTIILILYALKLIAKETKWTEDDKIVNMLIAIFNQTLVKLHIKKPEVQNEKAISGGTFTRDY